MPQGRLLCGFCLPTEGGAPDTPHNVSRTVSVNPKSNKSCRIVCTVGHDVCNVACLSASSSKEGGITVAGIRLELGSWAIGARGRGLSLVSCLE